MIAFLAGVLVFKSADYAIIEVQGIGYRVAVSSQTLAKLGVVGSDVFVHTHLNLRENEISLFGFFEEAERAAFLKLVEVSGVGPKVALATLSLLSPDALARAILAEDIASLSNVPGVGKKTAQRIVVDLKAYYAKSYSGTTVQSSTAPFSDADILGNALSDTYAALVGMGFGSQEIALALVGCDENQDSAALIRFALAHMGGR